MAELEHIWRPLRIGPVTIRNRIVMTAMTLGYGRDNVLSDRHIAFYRERARGGVALMITEQQAGHRLSKGAFQMGCSAWEKAAIPQFAKLADAVHELGAKQFVQLFGTGVHDRGTQIFDEWHPLWGVSLVPSSVHREVPMVMGHDEIRDVVEGFGESASNVMVSGLDGVEVQGAHGFLVAQFLSRVYNDRSDRYGGSVRNRCRFGLEVGKEIRNRVDGSITVGLRLSFEEWVPGGITAAETEEQIEIFAASGLFDYLSISTGGYGVNHKAAPPSTSVPEGFTVPLARRAKEIADGRLKIITAGRITRLEMAEEIIASGSADIVGMTRSHVADPYLVKKARDGRQAERVHCVGANTCQHRLWDQRPVACVMNPVAGREARWGRGSLAKLDDNRKRIAVVGGGPAGMRLAGLAAARGHQVRLFDADNELGGHLNMLKRLPGRDRWAQAVDDLAWPVMNGAVEVELGRRIDAPELDMEWCEIVVCACGSVWDGSGFSPQRPDRPEGIPGADEEHVFDIGTALERALLEPASLGTHVMVIDETGEYLPLGLADLLSSAGAQVDIVTPAAMIGADMAGTAELNVLMPPLMDKGVTLHTQRFVEAIDKEGVRLYHLWGGRRMTLSPETVVLSQRRLPLDRLFFALAGTSGLEDVRRVGDGLAPRKLDAVMYEAEQVGREI
jgi:2,4-dienoyl-CoA reductase-like NADH-dependent reductase (Old Yellow Enzyme family)